MPVVCHHGIVVENKYFADGPYNSGTGLMSTALKSGGYIPLTSPYSEDPRTIAAIPASIVDWVLVNLRSTATGATIASQSALLRNDGRIVGDDGVGNQIGIEVPDDNYYVEIKHRNHLPIMSSVSQYLQQNTVSLYDYSTAATQSYDSGVKEIKSGVWGSWAGDTNNDGQVTTMDYRQWFSAEENGLSGYEISDINCDGVIDINDFNIWQTNSRAGAKSSVP